APYRVVADGHDRRHGGGAPAWIERGDDGDGRTEERDPYQPSRLDGQGAGRQRGPGHLEQPAQALGDADARGGTDRTRDEAEDGRLRDLPSEYLAPRRADRTEQRQLSGPLRQRDGEGVEDEEAADEERRTGEGRERAGDEREVALHGAALLLPGRRAEGGLERALAVPLIERRLHPGLERTEVVVVDGGDGDRVEAGLAEGGGGRVRVEEGDGGARDAVLA